MTSIASSSTLDALAARLERVQPSSSRLWGRMTSHEMLCHLADSFRAMLGEREASSVAGPWLQRHLIKIIAIHTPLPWPKGVPTRPEVNPLEKGTRPAVFEEDRQAVITLMRRFAAPGARYGSHPMFGTMTRSEWLKWGYRHVDHHLRQFGL
jgi:Protein of unknown function (DUF1569)